MEEVKIDKRTQAELQPSAKVLSEPSVTGISPTPPKIDKRTRAYKDSLEQPSPVTETTITSDTIDYTTSANNLGFKLCMRCGEELPPNDDGSPRFRNTLELCRTCIWRNDK